MTSPWIEFEELLMRLDFGDVFLIVSAAEIGGESLVQIGEAQPQVVDWRLSDEVRNFGVSVLGRPRKLLVPQEQRARTPPRSPGFVVIGPEPRKNLTVDKLFQSCRKALNIIQVMVV